MGGQGAEMSRNTDSSCFVVQTQSMSAPKYFLYARKSTEADDRQVMSIEAQLFELREFARKENLCILTEYTESKSAKTPGRIQFNLMMARIESSREPMGIISWHPDRLARNSIDGGRIIYAVDTQKVVSLRFPTFWAEPTPQGLFMLQVAFGQSKYYSDNLKQNVERGIRQKLRRGEWLTKGPRGYVNNPKTRNIEPDPVVARVIELAYREYATGRHTYHSLSQFLAERGLVTKNGTPLGKFAMYHLLTNKAYLGLVHHKREFFPGSFAPILSPALFEAVQKVLASKARPRRSKVRHDFPFTGLFRCGECGSMITAQFARGNGGLYRYYRCSKKSGVCSQSYLQEELLAAQLKAQLKAISLPDEATSAMLEQVEQWDREEKVSSGSHVERLKTSEREAQAQLAKLVTLYLDGDIPKENYLTKKEELLTSQVTLTHQLSAARHERKEWVEPLRAWILDTKQAAQLASSDKYHEIRDFVRKVGTNPSLRDKSVSVSFCPPTEFLRARGPDTPFTHPLLPLARKRADVISDQVQTCPPSWTRTKDRRGISSML